MERQRQKERKAEIAKKERKRRIFELLMSAAAAISLPLVTVTGIFGYVSAIVHMPPIC